MPSVESSAIARMKENTAMSDVTAVAGPAPKPAAVKVEKAVTETKPKPASQDKGNSFLFYFALCVALMFAADAVSMLLFERPLVHIMTDGGNKPLKPSRGGQ